MRASLSPARDSLIYEYLAGGRALKRGDGRPGDFPVNLWVHTFLMTSPDVASGISALREDLSGAYGIRLGAEDLWLLDSDMWKVAIASAG